MKAEASKFTFSELYKHAANFNAKSTMNGVDLFVPDYKLCVDKLYDLTCAIYIIAFIKRYDASNIVATVVNEIKSDRELEAKTFMSKVLDLCVKKISRSNTLANIRYAIYTKIGLKKLYTVEQLDIAQTYTFDEIITLVATNNDSIDNPLIKSVIEMDVTQSDAAPVNDNYSLGKISTVLSDITNNEYKQRYSNLISVLYDSGLYLSPEVRSRAAAKLAEIVLNNGIAFKNIRSYLEIGAAPGACFKLIDSLSVGLSNVNLYSKSDKCIKFYSDVPHEVIHECDYMNVDDLDMDYDLVVFDAAIENNYDNLKYNLDMLKKFLSNLKTNFNKGVVPKYVIVKLVNIFEVYNDEDLMRLIIDLHEAGLSTMVRNPYCQMSSTLRCTWC
ncbi:hypothetical protein ACJJTC_002083 [Scirpophaga incertulas]